MTEKNYESRRSG